jgi:hypothetical protein
VGAIEAGLVRTAEDALTVLRQASEPLGPMARSGSRSRSGQWDRPNRVRSAVGQAVESVVWGDLRKEALSVSSILVPGFSALRESGN